MDAQSNIPISIDDFQFMFERIYQKNNVNNLSPEKIIMHITEEAGEVAKDMRHEEYDTLAKDLPDIFAWLCAFANYKGIRLETAVWKKYPRICPYCHRLNKCVCIAEEKKKLDWKELSRYEANKKKPASFQEWHEMFVDIYGNVNKILSHAAIGYHLMEEIGEVARSLRKDSDKNTEEEIADVFAWLIAITMKMGKNKYLDQMTYRIYPNQCKICHQEECICDCS